MARCIAAMPLAAQTAPTPASSAARPSSSTAGVGVRAGVQAQRFERQRFGCGHAFPREELAASWDASCPFTIFRYEAGRRERYSRAPSSTGAATYDECAECGFCLPEFCRRSYTGSERAELHAFPVVPRL